VPELVNAPELAALALLDAALEVATSALVAEHMSLIDDLRPPDDDAPVLLLADRITRRAAALRLLLARYRHAVRDCQPIAADHSTDDELF
jgi:hypothetical protein